MKSLLIKDFRLSASVLTYAFLAASLMTMLPGYPILCGAFFVSLGLFQSFQNAREANDIVFSSLLPIAKSDVVVELIGGTQNFAHAKSLNRSRTNSRYGKKFKKRKSWRCGEQQNGQIYRH